MIRVLGLLGVLTALAASGVRAQSPDDQQARSLFEAGRSAFAAGRYDDALRYFTESYELSGRGMLLYNMGNAAERARQDEEAIQHYRTFLEQNPEAEERAFVEGRIEFLEAQGERGEPEGVPTPEEVAAHSAVELTPSEEPSAAPPRGEASRGIASRWWFWTIIGVAVVGAGVGVGVAVSSDPGQEAPIAGDVGPGGVLSALVQR